MLGFSWAVENRVDIVSGMEVGGDGNRRDQVEEGRMEGENMKRDN